MSSIDPGMRAAESIKGMQAVETTLERTLAANQAEASQEKLSVEEQENSAMGIQVKTKKLEPEEKKIGQTRVTKGSETVLVRKEFEDLGNEFNKRHGQEFAFNRRRLGELAQDLIENDPQAILDRGPEELAAWIGADLTLSGKEPTAFQVNKGFDFLLWVLNSRIPEAKDDKKVQLIGLRDHIEGAKTAFEAAHAKEIQTIDALTTSLVKETGMTADEATGHFMHIIHNPQDVYAKIHDYCDIRKVGYQGMLAEFKVFLHEIGHNLKRKDLRQHIQPEILRLADEERNLQAILGGYKEAKHQFNAMVTFLRHQGVIEL